MARNNGIEFVNDMEEEVEEQQRLIFPYDRLTKRYNRLYAVEPKRDADKPWMDGELRYAVVQRPVALSYDEALNTRKDYYHPGGSLYDKDGNEVGTHPAGWFVDGYKWRTDRPQVTETSINLELGGGRVVVDDTEALDELMSRQR